MADGHSSATSGALRKPFTEQVAFFRRKLRNQVPTERWDDLQRDAHDTAFVVAGAQKADLLSDLGAAVDRAIAEGKSLDAFRKDFDAAVERNDWHGWTGEGSKGGRAWRTRTIYRTNAATSYAAGRRAQLLAGAFPLWVYRHGGSKEPRPEHLELDGLILPPGDPFWSRYSPPSEWGCSCYVLGARSPEAAAKRLGGDLAKQEAPAWTRTVDPATGAPPGIGKGWDYAPGASVDAALRAVVRKSGGWHYDLARAFMDALPDDLWDRLAASFRSLPSVAADLPGYVRPFMAGAAVVSDKRRTLGGVHSREAARIATADLDVRRFSWSIDEAAIVHVHDRHTDEKVERSRVQRPVTPTDFARLPAIIGAFDTVTRIGNSESGEPQIRLTKRIGGETYVAVFAQLAGRRTLKLQTLYVKRDARP